MNKYNNSKIYKICNLNEDEIYYGSTIGTLNRRLNKHISNYKSWKNNKYNLVSVFNLFDKYFIENCKIVLVEDFNCNSRRELLDRENYYISNFDCINIRNSRYIEKSRSEYYQKNKDKLCEYKKIYYQKNKNNIEFKNQRIKETKKYYEKYKDIIKNKNIDYYNTNKSIILAKKHEKINCICGGKYTIGNKHIHFKTKIHLDNIKDQSALI